MRPSLPHALLGLAALVAACPQRGEAGPEPAPPPSPAALASPASAAAPAAGLCGEHGVPQALCTQCNPALAAVFKARGDWCEAHGFPESLCPACGPRGAAASAPADWCGGHALPESKCTKCNPELTAGFKAAGDWCAEHGFPESACPICSPQAPPPGAEKAALEARTVRLGALDVEAAAGITTVAARQAEATASVACTARIAFDGDRVAEVRALVPGIVRAVQVEQGAQVASGAALFELESTRIGEVQAGLAAAKVRASAALTDLARQRALHEAGATSARKVELARRELAAARAERGAAQATLRIAGAAPAAASGRYTLTAPIAGTVVRRPAVLGLLATEDTALATIADTSVMWALCDVAEADASRVALGQRARVTVHGADAGAFVGTVTWIAAEVEPRTRTVAARVELPNPRGQLRANQFATARLETGAPRAAVSVPRAAVQRVGEREVVFVRRERGVYQPRVVRRYGDGEVVQIEGGVRAGDAVVTTGAVLLRTEIMPGSIGAGCCEPGAGGDG